MNYLGHLVLSGQDDEVLLGNFIADAIKGSSYKMYSTGVQKGILLHRKIDDFTDKHQSYLEGKRRFYDDYPKFNTNNKKENLKDNVFDDDLFNNNDLFEDGDY